jgi:hypothetical protein
MEVSTRARRSRAFLKIKLACRFPPIACFAVDARNIFQSSIYLKKKKGEALKLFVPRAKTLAQTVRCSIWVYAVTSLCKDVSLSDLRKICAVSSPGPKWPSPTVVCDRPATCLSRSTESEQLH